MSPADALGPAGNDGFPVLPVLVEVMKTSENLRLWGVPLDICPEFFVVHTCISGNLKCAY